MVQRMQEVRIYAAAVLESDAARWIPLLDKCRQERLSAVRHGGEYLRSISAGLLLRHAFLQSGYSQEQWRQARIIYGEYGKPGIRDLENFRYSISHSEGWVICAAAQTPVGADIQRKRPWKLQTAKRFFAGDEYDRIVGLETDAAQTECFYKMWTAKESCVKLTGRGVGAGISQYVTDSDFRHIRVEGASPFPIRIYDTITDYTVCICSEGAPFPEEMMFVDLHEI